MPSFRKLAAFSVGLGAFAIVSSNAQAATSVWDHNGSALRLEENGKKRAFVYDDPRGPLAAAGVKRGTVLFDGEEKSDGRLAGYAKLFRKGCSPVDYFVEGAYNKQKGEILLQGQAPIYSGNGCKITGYSDNGSASSLSFTRINGGEDYVARNEDGSSDHRDRPSYLPPPSLSSPDGASRDDRTSGTDRHPRYSDRNSPSHDDATHDEATHDEATQNDSQQHRYGQRDQSERDYSQRDDTGQDYYDRHYDSRDYSRRDDYPRDYAERHDSHSYRYYRRYDRYGYPIDPDADSYDSNPYYDDEDPAYIPYQPRWRRY